MEFKSTRNSLCWQIESKDHEPSYIFGTLHLPFIGQKKVIEALSNLLDKVSFFYAETNLDDLNSNEIMLQLAQMQQDNLHKHINSRQFKRFRAILKKMTQLDLLRFQHLPPLMILSELSSELIGEKGTGMDKFLWDLSAEKGIERDGLEPALRQVEIYGMISADKMYKQLKDLLGNLSKYRRHIHKLVELYRQQDIHALYKMTRRDLGQMRRLMINERNPEMAEKIHNHIMNKPDKSALFTFGAGHLSGERGVITLLKQMGLKVSSYRIFSFDKENRNQYLTSLLV